MALGILFGLYCNDDRVFKKDDANKKLEDDMNMILNDSDLLRSIPFVTNIREIDSMIRYTHKFCLLMADTNIGKSTFAIQTAVNTAMHYKCNDINKEVVVLTLEDDPLTVYFKSVAMIGNIPTTLIDFGRGADIKGTHFEDSLALAKDIWKDLPIVVTDRIYTPGGICAMMKKAQITENNIGLLVIDHIQMLEREKNDPEIGELFYTDAANRISRMARETGSTVLCTSQILKRNPVIHRFAQEETISVSITLTMRPRDEASTLITCTKNKFGTKGWQCLLTNDLEYSRFVSAVNR